MGNYCQQLRVINKAAKVFTPLHRELFKDLFRLSISRYSEVRKSAQHVLSQGFNLYSYSYRSLLTDVLHCLKEDSQVEHHQFKVCVSATSHHLILAVLKCVECVCLLWSKSYAM